MVRFRRRRAPVDGFLNVLKPAGVTSHYCVGAMRKLFRTTEIGHAGTLDPMATGVLVMGVGRATKFLPYLESDKAYRGVIRFGVTTDSDDITGTVLTEQPASWVTRELILTHLQRFVGAIAQVPPRVSALKIEGTRSYELARSNVDFTVKARPAQVHSIDLVTFLGGNYPEVTIDVDCGAGTYIRSIARECGEAIEIPELHAIVGDVCATNQFGRPCVGGTLTQLERTRSGAFRLADSLSLEDVKTMHEAGETVVHSIESTVSHLPSVTLNEIDTSRWLKNGQVHVTEGQVLVSRGETTHAPLVHNMNVVVFDASSQFLGVSTLEHKHSRFVLRGRTFIKIE